MDKKIITFHKVNSSNTLIFATLYPFNCYYETYETANDKRLLFNEPTNAVKYLLDNGYFIDLF
jgi:hypothetical protein